MRPTRFGWGAIAMAALTLLMAGSTGNNLLYLLFSAVVSALAVAARAGRSNLRRLAIDAQPPAQVFAAEPFRLTVRLVNGGSDPSFGVDVSWRDERASCPRVEAGGERRVELRGVLPRRGLNELTDLSVESSYPLSLFRFRAAAAPPRVLALPRPLEVREPREVAAQARASGRPSVRRGSGDELYGIREFAPGDDARVMNWKLSARAGRPLVNEYCEARADKITVTLSGARGEEGEREIARAAAACRFYIDSGAEVRLEAPDQAVDYGRGSPHLDKLLAALARSGDGGECRPTGAPPPLRAPAPPDSPTLRRLTLLGAWLTFAGMFLVEDVNRNLLWGVSPLLLLAVLVQERRWTVLPGAVWSLLSVGVLFVTAALEWRTVGVTVANIHLLLYLLLNRALTPLKASEAGQVFLIHFLAFFLISGLTISVWYFLLFVAYLAFAAAWLAAAAGASWPQRREWAGGWARSILWTAALTAAMFAALPRVEGLRRINPFLAAGMDKLAVKEGGVTSFTEEVALGFYGRLRKSSARIMRLKPMPAPRSWPGELHVRGASFDAFDGVKWTKSRLGSARAKQAGNRLVFPARRPATALPAFDVTMYPMQTAIAFTVGTPWLIEGNGMPAAFDHTDTIRFSSPYTGGISYRVHPSGEGGFFAADLRYVQAPHYSRFLQLPPDPDGRVAALAREITAGAVTPREKIAAVERHLRTRYDYSLSSSGSGRGLEDFLFRSRKGNCEYFASAGVILLRHAGVPARLVTGFLAGDWNEFGKFYDVRQAEAHAWVEAHVPGSGWLVSDPTPPQGLLAARAEALGRRLEHWFNALEAGWYRHVIGYDQYSQREKFRRWTSGVTAARLKHAADAAGRAAVPAAALVLLWLAGVRLRRRWAAPPPTLFQLAQFELGRAGLRRQPWWTEREFAAYVVGRRPELAPLAALAELSYGHRFRPGGLSEEEAKAGRRLLEELRSALSRR